MKKKDIEILVLKSNTHAQVLQKEAQETSEMHAAIAAISAQRESRAAKRERLRQQMAEVQKAIDQRLDAQQQHAKYLDDQARFNTPELAFWHDYLCMRIEPGSMVDRLEFHFTHMDERDWEKEAWFEISMETREYKVLRSTPELDMEKVERVLERLNEQRDLGPFLKEMRALFVTAMKN